MITCNNCNQQIANTNSIYKSIDLGTIKKKHWQSVGLECPHCQKFYHSHYTNDVLERRKARLKRLSGTSYQLELVKIQEYQRQTNAQGDKLFAKKAA